MPLPVTFPIRYAAVDQLPAPLLLADIFLEAAAYLLAVEASSQDRQMSTKKHKAMKIRDHS